MPFTLAHPAAAFPLRRVLGRYGCASALAIGAMAPDLGYFLPLGVSGRETHGLAGLFWFCVPVGLGIWLVFTLLVRPMALAVAPAALARRLPAPQDPVWSASRLLAACISLIAGALTHVAWDSFTHTTGFAVHALPRLQTFVPLFPGYSPQVCTLLQHGSSALGLGVLMAMAARWYRRAPIVRPDPSAPSWLKILIVLAIVVPSLAAGALTVAPSVVGGSSTLVIARRALVRGIFSAGSVFLAAVTITSLAWRITSASWRSLRPNEAGHCDRA